MSETRYVPMPETVRAAVYDDAPTALDLARLARQPHQNASVAAGHALARYLGSPDPVLLTDSGTSALVLALECLNIGPEDEVLLATFNCPQVIDAILAVGAVPVLIDSDPATGASDPASMVRAVTGRTRAIVLTHQFGAVASSTSELARPGAGDVDTRRRRRGAGPGREPARRPGGPTG